MKRFVAALAALLFAGVSHAQTPIPPVPQTGEVVNPTTGQQISIIPTTIFDQACNGGAGGIVGQEVDGVLCTQSVAPGHSNGTDYSSTITTANTWQMLMPANPGRVRFMLQNYFTVSAQGIPTTEDLFFWSGFTQPAPSKVGYELPPGASYDSDVSVVSASPIWVRAATPGHAFAATDWAATGLSIIGTPLQTVAIGTPYSFTPIAAGGPTPYAFSYTGTLPPGLMFSTTTGAITGTPTTAGTYSNIIITVQDADGVEQSLLPFSITVH